MIRLAQSEIYYPCKQEPDSGVTAIAVGICRLSDGYWLDWSDATFKNTGWVTQYQALTEDENGLWIYTTGWAIPNANAVYMVQWKITDAGGTFYAEGYQIVVNDSLLDKLENGVVLSAAGVDAVHDEVVEGSLTLRQITRIFLSALAGKSAGGGGVTLTFRDNADLKNRISATVDANGNRTAITLDGS